MTDMPRPATPVKLTEPSETLPKQTAGPAPTRTLTAPRVVSRRNPNRPLEMKNTLLNCLQAVGEMNQAEATVFVATVQAMQYLSKASRRKVLEALGKVYPS